MMESASETAQLGRRLSVHHSGRNWYRYILGISLLAVSILTIFNTLLVDGPSALVQYWLMSLLLLLVFLVGARIIWVEWQRMRPHIIVYQHGLQRVTAKNVTTVYWDEFTGVEGVLRKKRYVAGRQPASWSFGDGDGDFDANDLAGCLLFLLLIPLFWLRRDRDTHYFLEDGSPQEALNILQSGSWLATRYIFYSDEQPAFNIWTKYYRNTDGKHFVSLLQEASREEFTLRYSTHTEE